MWKGCLKDDGQPWFDSCVQGDKSACTSMYVHVLLPSSKDVS